MSTVARDSPMPDEPPRRKWYALDPAGTLVLALAVAAALAILTVVDYRRQLAAIPEPGRATPNEVIDEAWRDYDGGRTPADYAAEPQPPTRETPENLP